MAPGTGRLVGGIAPVRRTGNHLAVVDMTHGASGAAGVRFIVRAGVRIGIGRRPRRSRMAFLAGLGGDKVGRRFGSGKTAPMAGRAVRRHPRMGIGCRRPSRGAVTRITTARDSRGVRCRLTHRQRAVVACGTSSCCNALVAKRSRQPSSRGMADRALLASNRDVIRLGGSNPVAGISMTTRTTDEPGMVHRRWRPGRANRVAGAARGGVRESRVSLGTARGTSRRSPVVTSRTVARTG
jgi:hypothetical protein